VFNEPIACFTTPNSQAVDSFPRAGLCKQQLPTVTWAGRRTNICQLQLTGESSVHSSNQMPTRNDFSPVEDPLNGEGHHHKITFFSCQCFS